MSIRLHLGCGNNILSDYINIDQFNPNAQISEDILNLTYNDNMVDEVYCSHVLEHFNRYEINRALDEWYRILKIDAVLNIEVPDFEYCLKRWLESDEVNRYAFPFEAIFGSQDNPGQHHKFGFTKNKLKNLLYEAGFYDIVITDIFSHDINCFFVTAKKSSQKPNLLLDSKDVQITFPDGGIMCQLSGELPLDLYVVQFRNKNDHSFIYNANIKPGYWAKPNRKDITNWTVKIFKNNRIVYQYN